MATLVWDEVGERVYQAGIDRGVLFLNDGTVVPWNGLTSIEEASNSETKSFYIDGVKYLENLIPGDFVGKLKAITYPEEFDQVNGLVDVAQGLSFHNQPVKSFCLAYRTKIGNDLEGTEHAYKLHILYNLIANPEAYSFDTLNDSAVKPIEFAWSLTGTPPKIGRYKPTVHISIDSREADPVTLQLLEDKLYGTAISGPSLPTIQDVAEYFGYLAALIIIDHGDGTWSAVDESDSYITMISATEFQLDNVDALYTSSDTYEISSTNVSIPPL